MDFKKDIEPVLVSFIYGEINADQMIDILNNKIVKESEKDLEEEKEFERIVDEFNKIPENYHA